MYIDERHHFLQEVGEEDAHNKFATRLFQAARRWYLHEGVEHNQLWHICWYTGVFCRALRIRLSSLLLLRVLKHLGTPVHGISEQTQYFLIAHTTRWKLL